MTDDKLSKEEIRTLFHAMQFYREDERDNNREYYETVWKHYEEIEYKLAQMLKK